METERGRAPSVGTPKLAVRPAIRRVWKLVEKKSSAIRWPVLAVRPAIRRVWKQHDSQDYFLPHVLAVRPAIRRVWKLVQLGIEYPNRTDLQ